MTPRLIDLLAALATGTVVFLLYGVRRAALELGTSVGKLRAGTAAVVNGAVLALTVPLGVGSAIVVHQEVITARATPVARQWAQASGWQIQDISVRQGTLHIVAVGPPPVIGDSGLRERLDQAGLTGTDVRVTLVLGGSVVLPGRR